ncbi:MAG: TatD family hydrolase [Candidatus Bipolaricaulis sp.]|nr:TatD family hydrolase [Candidatus Bipolaricaulis sp.]
MNDGLSLDAHAHVEPTRTSEELAQAGAVLAMTLSLVEAAAAVERRESLVAWGVGCHPRMVDAQAEFDRERFEKLAERAPIVGEVGVDVRWSRVPLDLQLRTFRAALAFAARASRPVSIHSFTATRLVLDELRRTPVPVPILHWWTGTAPETREAVAMGCCFSVHSAVARRSTLRTAVPPERILVESDHGWNDPPAAIPCRVEWVEHLLSVQLKCSREDVRKLGWENFARIVRETGIAALLPPGIRAVLPDEACSADGLRLF